MSSDSIKQRLRELSKELDTVDKEKHRDAMALIEGRKVRITSDWNGQPYGTSRPSRKGQVFTVEHVSLQGTHIAVYVADFPYDSPPLLSEVEFLAQE